MFRFIGYTIHFGCINYCFTSYIGRIVQCHGPSMEPTIFERDVIFIEKLSHYHIQKGDIVVSKTHNNPWSTICKRVIGLEGDKVCTSEPSAIFKTYTYVPRGHVWLEGDNHQNSRDSRNYGPVPYGLIEGRAFLKLWPPKRFGLLRKSPNYEVE